MNEQEFSRKIRASLERAPLSVEVEKRLAQARGAALMRANYQDESALVVVGHRLIGLWRNHHAASLGMIVLLAALLIGAGLQWQKHRTAELAIDAQLLADELPIEAFLTDRFDQGGKP